MQADEISIADRGCEIVRHRLKMLNRRRRGSIRPRAPDDLHAVAQRSNPRDGASDSPAADDRESFAEQVLACGRVPCAAGHAGQRRRQLPGRRGNQQHRVFRDGPVQNTGRVGAEEAGDRRARLVDAVMPDAHACDDPAGGQRVVERPGIFSIPDDHVPTG